MFLENMIYSLEGDIYSFESCIKDKNHSMKVLHLMKKMSEKILTHTSNGLTDAFSNEFRQINVLVDETLTQCKVKNTTIDYLRVNTVSLSYGNFRVQKNEFANTSRALHFVNGTSLHESLFYLQKETEVIEDAQNKGKFNTTLNPWSLAGERMAMIHSAAYVSLSNKNSSPMDKRPAVIMFTLASLVFLFSLIFMATRK